MYALCASKPKNEHVLFISMLIVTLERLLISFDWCFCSVVLIDPEENKSVN